MVTTDHPTVNGVDVAALEGAVEAIGENPALGEFTFRAETQWDGALRSVTTIDQFDQAGETVHSRAFTLQGDEPEQILGERTGPNAVETVLAALGSCLSVGYAANAAHMGIELDALCFEMEGEVDLRGFLGIAEDVRPGYGSITCTVYLDADAGEATSPVVDALTDEVPLETRLVVE